MSWCCEIFNTYLAVLTRPKYKITVVSREAKANTCIARIQLPDSSELTLRTHETKMQVHVNCDPDWRYIQPAEERVVFHYHHQFSKSGPTKVKKQALILAKKLEMKPVYDVMKA